MSGTFKTKNISKNEVKKVKNEDEKFQFSIYTNQKHEYYIIRELNVNISN